MYQSSLNCLFIFNRKRSLLILDNSKFSISSIANNHIVVRVNAQTFNTQIFYVTKESGVSTYNVDNVVWSITFENLFVMISDNFSWNKWFVFWFKGYVSPVLESQFTRRIDHHNSLPGIIRQISIFPLPLSVKRSTAVEWTETVVSPVCHSGLPWSLLYLRTAVLNSESYLQSSCSPRDRCLLNDT